MSTFQILTLLTGTVLPVLTGLVTKASWGGGTRAVALLALSALAGLGKAALDAPDLSAFDWGSAITFGVNSFVVSVAMHFGVWAPLGVSDWAKGTLVKDRVGLAA